MAEANSKITGFHAHVYYDPTSRDAAMRVREGVGARFDVRLGNWHDKPIGPHTKSMYQVAFAPEHFGTVVPWLMLNREELDVLVHPETGDHVADHTTQALWLGNKLEVNVEFLQQFTMNEKKGA